MLRALCASAAKIFMKILILSRDKNYYSTKRLMQEALKLGHKSVTVDPLECGISVGPKLKASYGNLDLSSFDAVIPRLGILGLDYALLVARQLEFIGLPMLNSARALECAKNKFLSLQILACAGLPVPETLMIKVEPGNNKPAVPQAKIIQDAIKKLGGLPVVLKLFRGSQGKGVMLGESQAAVESILGAVWAIGFDIFLQKYLADSKGEDIRILVLSDEVIGAMKRAPTKNDFRSNVHQGGAMKKVNITAEEKALALAASKTLGLKLAGIDIIRSRKGPLVIEANGSPGFEGLEKTTGINIAKKIILQTIGL